MVIHGYRMISFLNGSHIGKKTAKGLFQEHTCSENDDTAGFVQRNMIMLKQIPVLNAQGAREEPEIQTGFRISLPEPGGFRIYD